MKISKILLSLVALFSVASSYAQTRDEIAIKMNEAGELMNKKDYVGAITIFEESLKMAQTTDEIEAMEELEPLANRNLGLAYRSLGMVSAHSKKYDVALNDFKKALTYLKAASDIVMQRNVEALISKCYTQLVGTQANAKQFTEAIGVCNEGLKTNPNDTKLMILLAQCYEKSGKDAESIATYEKVMDIAKRIPRLRSDGDKALDLLINGQLVQAVKLSEKGQYTNALSKITVAQKYEANSPQTAKIKLNIYSKAKNYNAIVKEGPAILALQTDAVGKSEVSFMIGAAYVALNKPAEAIKYYKQVTTGTNMHTAKTQITQLEANIKATEGK